MNLLASPPPARPPQHRICCAGSGPSPSNILHKGKAFLSPESQTFKIAFICRENMRSMKNIYSYFLDLF